MLAYRACQRSHVHELFCHVDGRQRVDIPVEGVEDSEFGVVHILGRAGAVCIECRVEVGDVGQVAARQPRLDIFARQDKARQWDGLTQRRRIEVVGVARCIGERGLLAHLGKGRACFQSVCVGAGVCVRVSARLEQESVEEGDGKRDSFRRCCRVTLDEIANRGKAAGSCPLGFGREWGERAAVIFQ